MTPANRDSLGTAHGAFATTHWTVVLSAQENSPAQCSTALSLLCQAYWPPLYAFLRRQGYSSSDAQDLVQGFFERFLELDSLRHVDREKGRFRSFLLVSLRHYVANVHREERTQRRGGSMPRMHLDEPGVIEGCEASLVSEKTPEAIFDRTWAETVMGRAAQRLRTEYQGRDKSAHYDTLRTWLAKEAEPGDYAAVAPQLGLTEGALAAAVFRLRRRFRELIREEVAHTVQAPEEIVEEMRYLLLVLNTQ